MTTNFADDISSLNHDYENDASYNDTASNNNSNNLRRRFYENLTLSETVESSNDDAGRTLKTFTGVFCPVALAQFSTLMFLRTGFVAGQAGLVLMIVQLFLAYGILILTILSICAISTNGAVKGGGVYFMISRTLGPEVGGSIGILFFLGNIFSSALYISGFVEALENNFGNDGMLVSNALPDGQWWRYLFGSVVCLFCLAVCMIGSSMFAKTSLVIFITVMICLLSVIVSFIFQPAKLVAIPMDNKLIYTNSSMPQQYANYTGFSLETLRKNVLYKSFRKDYTQMKKMNFLTVFAVLFAGVTGIMNGANMSGELKNPGKSIPWGTLGATVFTLGCYIVTGFLTACTCDRKLLLNSYLYMQSVNYWPPFVLIGTFATTLLAALGNLIGASRVLFALANDGIFGIILRPMTITIRGGNPIVSVVVSYVLVQLVLLIGKVNTIAPAVSVFFLLAYSSVNLACALLDLASASNFRPKFKYFTWYTSILGMISCTIMCFLIKLEYAIALIILFFVIIVILSFKRMDYAWGNIGQALLYHQVRKYLLLLDNRKDHVKYWRPQILLLMSNPRSQASLVKFVNILKKGGLFVMGHVIKGDFETMDKDPCNQRHRNFLEVKDYLRVKAFVDVTVSKTIREGCRHLVRLSGLGGMTVNTVCMGFWDDSAPQDVLQKMEMDRINNRSNWSLFTKKLQKNKQSQPLTGSQENLQTPNGILDDAANLYNSESNLPMTGDISTSPNIVIDENSYLVKNKNPNHGILKMKKIEKSTGEVTTSSSHKKKTQFLNDLPKVRVVQPSGTDMIRSNSSEAIMEGNNEARSTDRQKEKQEFAQISKPEYVGIIEDCIKMQKNITLARHFTQSSLFITPASSTFSSNQKTRFIDVWPINFFQPGTASYMDNSCKLMLQLACIMRMSNNHSGNWRIRVFICLDYYCNTTSTMSGNTTANNNNHGGDIGGNTLEYGAINNEHTEQNTSGVTGNIDVVGLWKQILKQWRINAELKVVQWDDIVVNLEEEMGRQLLFSTGITNSDSMNASKKRTMSLYQSNLPDSYISEVNLLLRRYSLLAQTAVCLLYLPIPPSSVTFEVDKNEKLNYLRNLTEISEELPPSLFVCGQQEVMTVAI